MTLPRFAYAAPSTVEEAVTLLTGTPGAAALAGGHALLYAMKTGRAAPPLLVDLGRIDGLSGVRPGEPDGLAVGATTTLAELADRPGLAGSQPALAEALAAIGDPQLRNRATVGGNVAGGLGTSTEGLRTDLPAVLLAAAGSVAVTGPMTPRVLPAAEFFAGGSAARPMGEVVTGITLPGWPAWYGAYEKFRDRASLAPVVGVAVAVRLGDDERIAGVRIGLTGSVDAAQRARGAEDALMGVRPTARDISRALPELPATAFVGRRTASPEYLGRLAAVLIRRAVLRVATPS